jgi:hypothetical protein
MRGSPREAGEPKGGGQLSTPTAQFVCKQGGDDPPYQLSSQIASTSFLSYNRETNPYDAPFSNTYLTYSNFCAKRIAKRGKGRPRHSR